MPRIDVYTVQSWCPGEDADERPDRGDRLGRVRPIDGSGAAGHHRRGLLATRLDDSHNQATRAAVAGYVELLVEVRRQARADGWYQQADDIRRRLGVLGAGLNDGPTATSWSFTDPDAGAG